MRALIRDLGSTWTVPPSPRSVGLLGAFRLPAAAVTGDEEADARSWRDAVVPLRGTPLALPALALGDRSSPAASGRDAPLDGSGRGRGGGARQRRRAAGRPEPSPPRRSAPGSSWPARRLVEYAGSKQLFSFTF